MNQSSFLAVLHELFEADAGTIQSTSVLQDVPGWSSLTFIGLIAMIDEEFDVTVSPGTILKCRSVADLLNAIDAELTQTEVTIAEPAPLKMAA